MNGSSMSAGIIHISWYTWPSIVLSCRPQCAFRGQIPKRRESVSNASPML